ncbi:MAG TPA: hypothetical protein VI636_16870 [Candidatus Angelobacter sp.]
MPRPTVPGARPSIASPNRITRPNFLPVTKSGQTTGKTPAKAVAQPKTVVRPVIIKPPAGGKPGVPGVRDHRTVTTVPGRAGTATAPAKVPPKVLTATPAKPPQTTPQLNNIRFVDPNFARNIVGLRPATGGSPRSQMKVPISPVPDPTDEVLFEDPVQAGKKYYLPRYKVAAQGQKYQISFKQDDAGWSFMVNLTKFAAPSIATAAKTAQEIDHHVAVLVRFSQMIGNQAGAQEELSFQEVTLKNDVLTAALHLDSLPQRDLLYQALQDRSFGTALVVRRAVTVAVPIPQPPAPLAIFRRPGTPPPPSPTPAVPQYRQAERVIDETVDPRPFVFSPSLHKYIFAGVTPESSGENLGLTRCEVAGTDGRTYTYYQDGAKPYVFYYLPDSFKLPRRQDGAHEPLVSASFGQAAAADELKATFSFIAVPYVDPNRLATAGPQLKNSISELPKGVDGPQFEPLLAAPGKIHFSLSYPGCDTSKGPYELRDKASVDLRSGIHDSLQLSLAQFQSLYDALFSPSSVLLTGKVDVDLGADAGEEIPFSARLNDLAGDFLAFSEDPLAADGTTAAAPDGSGGPSMKDSLTSALGDAAQGNVDSAVVDLVGGLAGKLFSKKKKDKKKKQPDAPPAAAEAGVQATWQNIIESPVEIDSLSATLVRGEESLPATIDGLDLSQPVQIPPGQQITFTITPADATAAGDPVHADYDLSGVRPVPDREAIWNEILDPTAPESYLTTITVKTPASTFAAPADNPGQQIVSMVVDFDSGVSTELNSTKLEAKVDLPHPVVNFVLRKADSGEYRYKLTLVRSSGEQTRDADWRPPETTTVLFPAVG